jgi:ribosomal protein S18 acetylase RimI-like enzyme
LKDAANPSEAVTIEIAPGGVGWIHASASLDRQVERSADSPASRIENRRCVAAAVERLTALGARIAQALAPRGGVFGTALADAGVPRVTEVVQLAARPEVVPRRVAASARIERRESRDRETFAALVATTYDGSLDIPELNGAWSMADVFAGYDCDAATDPSEWWVAVEAGRERGCLIVRRWADLAAHEILYLGVAPTGRRRGVGAWLCGQAAILAAAAGSGSLFLSVDARNEPALSLYRSAGFAEIGRDDLHLKLIGPS